MLEKFIKKVMFGVGGIIVIAVAFMPLSTGAATQVTANSNAVSLTVNKVLALSLKTGTLDLSSDKKLNFGTITPGESAERSFRVNVVSNHKYTLSLSATALTNGTVTIPGSASVSNGNNAYGYKKSGGSYVAASTTSSILHTSDNYITAGSTGAGQDVDFTVGIAIGKSAANTNGASLSSTITVTAAYTASNGS